MKKILTVLLVAALMSSAAAFAEELDATSVQPEEGIVEIKDEVHTPMYVRITASASKVSAEDGYISVSAIDSYDQEVSFIISEDTLVVDTEGKKAEITDGAQFTAFTMWNKPTVLMLPPRYNADVIVIDGSEMLVDADAYEKAEDMYVNAANSLALNISEETEIVDREGAAYEGELDGMDLLVFYAESTRSIPAQTNPKKIIVLGESGLLPSEIPGDEDIFVAEKIRVGETEFEIADVNGVEMTAVRPVAEALGLEVSWDNELKKVTVGTVQMGVGFAVGENSYSKAKMTPFVLEAAPVVEETEAGGVTYVPISFFTEVLGCNAEVDGNTIVLSY